MPDLTSAGEGVVVLTTDNNAGSVYVSRTEAAVATVVLSQPQKKNAISATMMAELAAVLLRLDADASVAVIVLRGAEDNFSSGGDLAQVPERELTAEKSRLLLRSYLRAVQTLRAIAKPVIAMADGYVVGGGFSLLLACDLVCVSDRVVVIPAFCKVGIIPEMGMMKLLPDAVGEHVAKEILFTNRRLDAHDLQRLGLANRVFPAQDLERGTTELATLVAGMPALSVQVTKEIMNSAGAASLDAVIVAESTASPLCGDAVRRGGPEGRDRQ
jgi:2-(1,2-epoxy-1,2-dihydrophenyl)acetyl-CoA isomerase